MKRYSPLLTLRLFLLWVFLLGWGFAIYHGPRGISNNVLIPESFPALFQVGPAIVKLLLSPSLQWGVFIGAIALAIIFLATAVFGRWYCASLCPMGVLQDFSLRISRKVFRNVPKQRFYHPRHYIPWILLALIAYGLLRGSSLLYTFFEPYSVAMRPLFLSFEPIVRKFAYHSFASDFQSLTGAILLVSALWLLGLLLMAAIRGRFFCRHLCPVGAILELFSMNPVWKLKINPSQCVACRKCESVCRASCVDPLRYFIESKRCILCFECVSLCPTGAINYLRTNEPLLVGETRGESEFRGHHLVNRREFLKSLSVLCLSVVWILLEPFSRRNSKERAEVLIGAYKRYVAFPPGAESLLALKSRCVGCGLCQIVCPSGVIQLSIKVQGFSHPALPGLNYSRGYCQYECRRCMVVCPTGALRVMPLEEKKKLKIGISRLIRSRCIIVRHGRPCGACAEHCPTGAITLEVVSDRARGRRRNMPEPVIHESLCIGCGACETVCPAKPTRAIYIEGLEVQEKIQGVSQANPKLPGSRRDFPF
ncbi:MAG: 4Fe-4S dicluster domain-containing protein [Syntrophobacterales bacterium]|nr:4Fe-4S dicluster domain-containing protein [Syntrophobacterales bacterium]